MNNLPFYIAHGAGAGHTSSFLQKLKLALSEKDQITRAVTFRYMEEQESTGKKRPPPRFEKLVPEFIDSVQHEHVCLVGGKSMGGRVASQLSHMPMVKGIVCFGFPFYPSGKPEKHRLSFLNGLKVPCLIIQGTRDSLGNKAWVEQQSLPENIEIEWIEGADHDFKTLKKQNKNSDETIQDIINIYLRWIAKHNLR